MLSEKIKQEMMGYFAEVAKLHGEQVEDVIERFDKSMELITLTPSAKGKSEAFLMSRAKAVMDDFYANKPKEGIPYNWCYFSKIGKVNDWNDGLIKEDEELLKTGKMDKLLKEGRVVTMKSDGKDVPVSQITKLEKKPAWIFNGNVVEEDPQSKEATKIELHTVVEGTPLKPGEKPIFRDHRIFNVSETNGNKPNLFYSRELNHSYEITIVGLAFPVSDENDVRLFERKIGYDQANPKSDKYFFKKFKPFHMYVGNFVADDAKSKPWKYSFSGKTAISAKTSDMDTTDLDIKIEELLNELLSKYGEEAAKNKDFIPQVYYANQLKEGHERCLDLKDGQVQRSKTGYEKTKWNSYLIVKSNVTLLESSKKPGVFYYILNESSLKKGISAFIDQDSVFEPPAKLPGTCIMVIKTKRDTNRYDADTKKKVYDPENADVQCTIESIASIGDVPKMEIEITEIGYGEK